MKTLLILFGILALSLAYPVSLRSDYVNKHSLRLMTVPPVLTQASMLPLKNYYGTTHPFTSATNNVRTDLIAVTFPQAFSQVPSVGLALVGFDIQTGQMNFELNAQDITTTGFNVKVTVYAGASLYAVQASYIATLSQFSGLYIVESSVDKNVDSDLANIAAGMNERSVSRKLNLPANLKNPKGVAFLRSAGFFGGTNIRLRTSILADNSLQFLTWWDTKLSRVSSTAVYWDSTDPRVKLNSITTAYQGVLASKSGERHDPQTITLGDSNCPPQIFAGLWWLDLANDQTYRVQQALSTSGSTLKADLSTWSDTVVYQLQDNVLALSSCC